jgi:hypothetical protein
MKHLLPKVIIVLYLLSFCQEVRSQNISNDTIEWNATGFNDLRSKTSKTKVYPGCRFISYRNDKIQWIQKNGNVVYDFTINKTKGDWPNINNEGEIQFEVELDKQIGKIFIKRTKNDIKLTIYFPEWSRGSLENRYQISNFKIL